MKFVSWNVNGLRARLKKDFMPAFRKLDADIFAVQEIKMQAGEAILELDGCKQFWNYGERKGYSGTAIFSRIEPQSVKYGIGVEEFDRDQCLRAEFAQFGMVGAAYDVGEFFPRIS